jgi:mRNA-degrading endonuclease toxin of MazEF toxin-antitoxin module
MSAEALRAGQIVLSDWRGDGLPKEPNKRRPAIIVEDVDLFDPSYPNLILVPLTEHATLIIRDLATAILPTQENGCTKPCWALATHVTATSKHRITATASHITQAQLVTIRRQIALAIGFEV